MTDKPTDAMIEAAWHAHRNFLGVPKSPFLPRRKDCRELYETIYTAMHQASDTLLDLIERALPFVKDRPGTPPLVLIAEIEAAIGRLQAKGEAR
jgi:hypothetical protein